MILTFNQTWLFFGIFCKILTKFMVWIRLWCHHNVPSKTALFTIVFSLWEMGHVIVGVEAARTALEEFFEENSIKYIVSDLPDGAGSLFTVSLLIHPLPSLHFSEQQEYISFSVVNLLKFSVCTAAVNAYLIDIKIFSLHIICCLRWQMFIWPTIYVIVIFFAEWG